MPERPLCLTLFLMVFTCVALQRTTALTRNRQSVTTQLKDGRWQVKSNAVIELSNQRSKREAEYGRPHVRHKRATVTFTQDQMTEITTYANSLRADEGSSSMKYMGWNSDLAEQAQAWADTCVMEHGNPSRAAVSAQYSSVGQNLFMVTITDPEIEYLLDSWFDEKDYYTYDTRTCESGKVCGHYTQVVWGDSREQGCGKKFCSSLEDVYAQRTYSNAYYVVCNYGPAGNIVGEFPYRKGPACTECSTGSYQCYNNALCRNCTAHGVSGCTCTPNCGCGTLDSDSCTCQCQTGWMGGRCCTECGNTHANCGNSWPDYSCSLQSYIPSYCPLLCGGCQTGGSCTLTNDSTCAYYRIFPEEAPGDSSSATTAEPEATTTAPPCASHVCNNGGVVYMGPNGCACNCASGFQGASCEVVDISTWAVTTSGGTEEATTNSATDSTTTDSTTAAVTTTGTTTTAAPSVQCPLTNTSCHNGGTPVVVSTGCVCTCADGWQGDTCTGPTFFQADVLQAQASAGVILDIGAPTSMWSTIWNVLHAIIVTAVNDACNSDHYSSCCPGSGPRGSTYEPYVSLSTVKVADGYPQAGSSADSLVVMLIAEPMPDNQLCTNATQRRRREAPIAFRTLVLRRLRRAIGGLGAVYIPQDVLHTAVTSVSSNITTSLTNCCNATLGAIKKGEVVVTTAAPPSNAGLPGWTIALIVIGVLLLVALPTTVVLVMVTKAQKRNKTQQLDSGDVTRRQTTPSTNSSNSKLSANIGYQTGRTVSPQVQ